MSLIIDNPKPLKSRKLDIALKGEIKIPGDKSVSHRSLIFAALANGQTKITGLLKGEDVLNTAHALELMGVDIVRNDDHWLVNGSGIVGLMEPCDILDMGNSGTAARLLAGLVAPYDFTTFFTGDSSLRARPMSRIFDPIKRFGAQIVARQDKLMPFAIIGTDESIPIEYEMKTPSAQIKSCILLAALATRGTTTIYEPKKCRDHSEIMMRYLGLDLKQKNEKDGTIIECRGFNEFAAKDIDVISDISSASFFIVAATLVKDSDITLPNIGINPLRFGIIETLLEMGADIELFNKRQICGEEVADIRVKSSNLRAVNVPAARAASMIDEYPILAVAAANAVGVTRMNGLAELRVKESDRLAMIANNLSLCGVELSVGDDFIEIKGQTQNHKKQPQIKTAMDHRIAMSFLVMGLTMESGLEIDDYSMIKTSFPDFTKIFNEIGIDFFAI